MLLLDMLATEVEAGIMVGVEACRVAETGVGMDARMEGVMVRLVVGTDMEGWLITYTSLEHGEQGKRPYIVLAT